MGVASRPPASIPTEKREMRGLIGDSCLVEGDDSTQAVVGKGIDKTEKKIRLFRVRQRNRHTHRL
jgi:hypothetical protein